MLLFLLLACHSLIEPFFLFIISNDIILFDVLVLHHSYYCIDKHHLFMVVIMIHIKWHRPMIWGLSFYILNVVLVLVLTICWKTHIFLIQLYFSRFLSHHFFAIFSIFVLIIYNEFSMFQIQIEKNFVNWPWWWVGVMAK